MKILVIGKGGREHALAYACKRSALCDELICAPGNPGMAKIGECVNVKDNDVEGLVGLDFLNLGRRVANEGAFCRFKNGLLEAVERWVGLDPRSFPRREVAVAPLVIIPGGAVDAKQRCWRTPKNGYLFAHKALAKVFRARVLQGMREAKLMPQKALPDTWVVDCRKVGNGLPALKYLSRYLYRGVISERQLVADDGESVTFAYRDGTSGKRCTRTVSGAHFVWLIIQHVLPTRFRRARDYGFLHGNARKTLIRVQWFLKVAIDRLTPVQPRPPFLCKQCGKPMKVTEFTPPDRLSG